MKKSNTSEPDNKKRTNWKTLIIHGEKYKTLYTKKFESRKNWQKPNEKEIISVLPGTVIELFAKPGEKVNENDKMIVLEAMKMRNTYYYPISGEIKCVHVKVGDKIPKNQMMIELE